MDKLTFSAANSSKFLAIVHLVVEYATSIPLINFEIRLAKYVIIRYRRKKNSPKWMPATENGFCEFTYKAEARGKNYHYALSDEPT